MVPFYIWHGENKPQGEKAFLFWGAGGGGWNPDSKTAFLEYMEYYPLYNRVSIMMLSPVTSEPVN